MVYWPHRRHEGWGRIQRANLTAIVVLVILACAAVYSAYHRGTSKYGYRHWTRHVGTPPAATISGRPWVIDGDTIEVAGARIRLEGIDAPEAEQTCSDVRGQPWPCGKAATRELKALIAGRDVTCSSVGYDRYRRVLAVCSLSGMGDINAWMVRQGFAVAYGYGGAYQAEQDAAQAARRGIWAGTFLPPSEWRRRSR